MPDRFGFDHLGTEVRCIEEDCAAGGALWAWPEKQRRLHHAGHDRERAALARARAREVRREATARIRMVNRLRKEART